MNMNATAPLPWPERPAKPSAETGFHAVFGNAPAGVARCDRQGIILEMNPALERILGRGSESTRPLRLRDLVPMGECDRIDSLVRELMDARLDSFRLETRGTGKQQAYTKWTAWRMSDVGDGSGDSLLIVEDAPEDRISDNGLQQRHRWEAVGRLAGGVFHDFNNLLTGVTLYCELLLAGLETDNRLWRYADEIRSAVLQANGLVRQLLVLARQRNIEHHVSCLNEIASGMQNLLARLIGENIAVKFHLAPDLGLVKIDPAQAQQILLNLVLNARDALPAGGEITVETSNYRFHSVAGPAGRDTETVFPCVFLVVADNGKGMDCETRQRLFEPFFTTKSPDQGSGLGLATVHNIVSRNGGLIHVESEPGRGTRMMILLPRVSESAAETRETCDQDPGVLPQTQNQKTAEELIL
jgi:two-component system, cell cycle sensor histidine kinase and response regulator CckA